MEIMQHISAEKLGNALYFSNDLIIYLNKKNNTKRLAVIWHHFDSQVLSAFVFLAGLTDVA